MVINWLHWQQVVTSGDIGNIVNKVVTSGDSGRKGNIGNKLVRKW